MAEQNALASLLARRWALEVRPISEDDTGEWTRVRGINSFQPTLEPSFEDSTDFDNDGWSTQEKTLQGWSLAIGFIEKVGAADRAQDPGQVLLERSEEHTSELQSRGHLV